MLTITERTEGYGANRGHYEVQEVDFGRVYRWCPECINIECECGERLTFTAYSIAACPSCGANHAGAIREALTNRRLEDQTLIPGATTPGTSKMAVYLAEAVDDGGGYQERVRTGHSA